MRLVLCGAVALTILLLPSLTQAQLLPGQPNGRPAVSIRPDLRMSPEVVAISDPAVFCRAGYSRSVRHTSGKAKRDIYRAYGIDRRSDS